MSYQRILLFLVFDPNEDSQFPSQGIVITNASTLYPQMMDCIGLICYNHPHITMSFLSIRTEQRFLSEFLHSRFHFHHFVFIPHKWIVKRKQFFVQWLLARRLWPCYLCSKHNMVLDVKKIFKRQNLELHGCSQCKLCRLMRSFWQANLNRMHRRLL